MYTLKITDEEKRLLVDALNCFGMWSSAEELRKKIINVLHKIETGE